MVDESTLLFNMRGLHKALLFISKATALLQVSNYINAAQSTTVASIKARDPVKSASGYKVLLHAAT